MTTHHLQSLLYPGATPVCSKKRSISFDDLYELFVIYKSIHGNLRIPQKYLIPEGDQRYPQSSWGFKLGAQLNGIYTVATWTREGNKQKLIELGILPEENQIHAHLSPGDVAQALSCYKQLYGNVNDMPLDFHVPKEASCYPTSLQGCPLGEILDCIRTRRLFFNYENLKRWRELQIEFFSELYDQSFSIMKDAFLAAHAVTGNGLQVPHDFIVPNGDSRYPSHTWGCKLGSQLHNIRSHAAWVRGIYQTQLIEVGILPPQAYCPYSADDIVNCVQIFIDHFDTLQPLNTANHSPITPTGKVKKAKKSNKVTGMDVPTDYVIPSDSNLFPTHMNGVCLGEIVGQIQRRELFFDIVNVKKWKALGISFERRKVNNSSGSSRAKTNSPVPGTFVHPLVGSVPLSIQLPQSIAIHSNSSRSTPSSNFMITGETENETESETVHSGECTAISHMTSSSMNRESDVSSEFHSDEGSHKRKRDAVAEVIEDDLDVDDDLYRSIQDHEFCSDVLSFQ